MGGNPRYRTWSPAQWRSLAPTAADLAARGWPVHARCLTCQLEMDVDLARVIAERGPALVLWGRTSRCRRRRCQGRMAFYVTPPRADGEVIML